MSPNSGAALDWQRPELDTSLNHENHAGPPTSASVDPAAIDHSAVVGAAGRAGVFAPLEITLPTAPGEGVGVTEIDKPYRLTTNAVALDPATMSVTTEIDYWRDYSVVAKLADWGIRMHMGVLFGLLNQLLLLGIAIALVTVIVRGYRMWWQRRPTRGSQWAVGRPPLRGGIRRLHPATAALAVTVIAAVGWFLPLLGISLVGFVVLDAVAGAVKAHRLRSVRMN